MIKVADKPSTDPVQQKLRMLKKQWNKDVSAFIDNLIHYKKLTNGQPNKFYKEKSSIKDPIPADPATIIGTLANDFQELSQRANAIIASQSEYSRNRRKKQPKPAPGVAAPSTPAPAQPQDDLTKQLAAFENKYELVAEASNPVSRFFTRLLTPTFGLGEAARVRKFRMTLLKACATTYKSAGKFQVEVVKSSPQSINSANKALHKFWNDWMIVYRGFTVYKSNMPKEVVDAGGEIPPIETEEKKAPEKEQSPTPAPAASVPHEVKEQAIADLMGKAKEIISDYAKNHRRLPSDKLTGLEVLLTRFGKSPREYQPLFAEQLITEYRVLISNLNQSLQTSGTTLGEIANQLEKSKAKPAVTASEQLEVVSQDFLNKWLGKVRHQLISNDTSAFRLDLYKMAGEIRQHLDKMMDSLESGMNLEELQSHVQEINSKVIAMRGLMRALHNAAPPPPKTPSKSTNPDDWGQRFDALEKYM